MPISESADAQEVEHGPVREAAVPGAPRTKAHAARGAFDLIRQDGAECRRAGLIEVTRGREGGAHMRQPLDQITLRAVFAAVESLGSHALFRFHESPNPACPLGRNIHGILDGHLMEIQHAMEREMERVTLADVTEKARALLK